MAHRQTQARDYVQKALLESGATNLKYEMRGRHPAFEFDVRVPGVGVRRGVYVFSQTPRIDKDLNMISHAKRCVRDIVAAAGPPQLSKNALMAMMVKEGHDEFIAELIGRQFELGDRVARLWVEEFLKRIGK